MNIEDLEGEIWKPIQGLEEFYEISNKGRLKSFYKKEPFIRKVKLRKDGYWEANLALGHKKYKFKHVHRLVAEAFIPNPEDKSQVNHIDGVKTNNCVENLEWCTPSENGFHAYKLGLSKPVRGEVNHNAKLNEDLVRKIRKMYYEDKIGQITIAKELDVNKNAISGVITWRTWFYVDPELKEYYLSIPGTKNKNNYGEEKGRSISSGITGNIGQVK